MSKLIVFIHGIGSDGKVWDDFIKTLNADNETKNIQKYENLNSTNDDVTSYILYEYDSTIAMPTQALAKLKEKATGRVSDGNLTILDHAKTLESKIRQWEDTFDSIDIVAHSMGGIITMFMFFSLLEKESLFNKINKCLLYAVPLKGSEDPDALIKFLGKSVVSPITQELLPNSITIEILNQQLNLHKELLKKHVEIQYIAANADSRIVQVDDRWIQGFGEIEHISGDHSTVVKPKSMRSDSFFWFKKHIIKNGKKTATTAIFNSTIDDEQVLLIDRIISILKKEGIECIKSQSEHTGVQIVLPDQNSSEKWRIYRDIDSDENHYIFITDIERSESDIVENIKKQILEDKSINQKDLYNSVEAVTEWSEWENSGGNTSDSGGKSIEIFENSLQEDFWVKNVNKIDTVIDLGVGSGAKTTKIIDLFKNNNINENNIKFVVVDNSSQMMKMALKKIKHHAKSKKYTCITDGLNTDFLTFESSKKCFQGERELKSAFFLLGGTFGNINEEEFLISLKSVMNKGDIFVLGVFTKGEDDLDTTREKYNCSRVQKMFAPSLRNLGLNLVGDIYKTDWLSDISKIENAKTLKFCGQVKLFDSSTTSITQLFYTTRYDENNLKEFINSKGFSDVNTHVNNNVAYIVFEYLGEK